MMMRNSLLFPVSLAAFLGCARSVDSVDDLTWPSDVGLPEFGASDSSIDAVTTDTATERVDANQSPSDAGCTPGSVECGDKTPRRCDAHGTWIDDPACEFGCDKGICTGSCHPGDHRCDGKTPQSCSAGGTWASASACPYVCQLGNCSGECEPGAKICDGQTAKSCDASGHWQAGFACPFACETGDCVGVCSPGTKQCQGSVPQSCDANGQWTDGPTCQAVCSAGVCVGSCPAGTQQCNGKTVQTCGANGTWQDSETCPYLCSSGKCAGACTPGSKECNGGIPSQCDGAGHWQDGQECPFACSGGDCVGKCKEGDKQCSGNIPQTCDQKGTWVDGAACEHICTMGSCTGNCDSGDKQCKGDVVQTCDQYGNWKDSQTCTYVCNAGGCGGTCKPGATQCSGNNVMTCQSDGLWNTGSTCAGQTPVCNAGQCVSAGCATQVSAGGHHTCARKQDGTLWCWGSNYYGELGDGTTTNHPSPAQVSSLGTAVAEVALRGSHACARKQDDTIWCWGDNGWGALGDGSTTNRFAPALVTALGGGSAGVSAGGDSCCARKSDGNETCYGSTGGKGFTCARKKDGTLWCWGDNSSGQIGDDTRVDKHAPVQVTSLGTSVDEISAGDGVACARNKDGSLWCWGYNSYGQLGDGTTTDRLSPVEISSLGTNVAGVSLGDDHSCARKKDGSLWCWGINYSGQLGDGSDYDSLDPVQVTSLGTSVVEVSAGGDHTCARKQDGTVWCWGSNTFGQLGIGSRTERAVPAQVADLGTSVVGVSSGLWHTCARRQDGSVWCWGRNYSGALGDGTTTDRLSPVQVDGLCP